MEVSYRGRESRVREELSRYLGTPMKFLGYIGDAVMLVDRLDPEKKLGQEKAEQLAAHITRAISEHNLNVMKSGEPHRRIDREFGDLPFSYFRDRGFDLLERLRELIEEL